MRVILNILGALLVMVGGIWFLQGINVLPGSFLHTLPLTRLQIERMPLDFFDDVLLEHLALEAFERTLQALAIMNLNFSQRNSPQFLIRIDP